MAVTFSVDFNNANRLVKHGAPYYEAELVVNGGNPYVPGGVAFTAAALETALQAVGVYQDVTAIDACYGLGFSTNGLYYAVYVEDTLRIFIGSTGLEAGAIDLSAAATEVRVFVRWH